MIALVGGIVAILTWDSGSSSEHARQERARREAHESLYGLEQALSERLAVLTSIANDPSRRGRVRDPETIVVWQSDGRSAQFLLRPGPPQQSTDDIRYATLAEQVQRRADQGHDEILAPLPAADGRDYIVVLHRQDLAGSVSWTAAAESIETLLLDAGAAKLTHAAFDLDVLDLDSDRLLYQTRPRLLVHPESLTLEFAAPGAAKLHWQLRAARPEPSVVASLPRWVLTLLFGGSYAALAAFLIERPRKLTDEIRALKQRLSKLNEQLTQALRDRLASEGHAYDLTHQDKATNTPNRLAFEEALEAELSALRKGSEGRLIVIVAHLVSLEEIRQAYGQRDADAVLREACKRIRDWTPSPGAQALRLTDTLAPESMPYFRLARIGELDLAVLLRSGADASCAQQIISEIGDALAVSFTIENGGEAHVNAAFGLCLPEDGLAGAAELIEQAVLAAHEAAQRSPGSTATFEPTARSTAAIRLQRETELRRALRRGELVLHYQPIVATDSARVCGFEALIRWHHPLEGLLSPARFLAVADTAGLLLDIDRLVLRQAALQARQWAVNSQMDFFLSFNLSPRHFARRELVSEVRQLLEECRVAAGRLRIEITESAIIGNIEAASRVAAELRESGVKLCLDDFGTGYSSLNYLRVLPLDGLKVDRSFVERMVSDTRDFGVVKTIVDLAHYLQLYCVVEGVESSSRTSCYRSSARITFKVICFPSPYPRRRPSRCCACPSRSAASLRTAP